MITKKNKERLTKLVDFHLSDLDNKIISYKNNNIKIPKDKLKDFMSSELQLFIPSRILKNDFDKLEESIYNNIDYLRSINIIGINDKKLLKTLKDINENNITDKVLLLSDNNDNIFRLYIRVLPPTAYNYTDISFVINITDNIIEKYDTMYKKVNNKGNNNLKVSFYTRSGIFEVISMTEEILTDDISDINGFNRVSNNTINNYNNKEEQQSNIININIYRGIDVIYLKVIDNIGFLEKIKKKI